MRFHSHAQSGLTLMELLIALSIAAMLAAPLGAVVLNALDAQSVGGDTNDLAQQAQFAMQRMEAAVRRTAQYPPPSAKPPSASTTTADWLVTVLFCKNVSVNGSAQLIETRSTDPTWSADSPLSANPTCDGTRVIADKVTAFSAQTYDAGVGAAVVIEIKLTLSGATGQSVDLTSHTRLGGGTL